MMREVLEVKRCNRCQTVVQALVDDRYLAGTPEESRAIYWMPYRTHTRDDCERMLTLAREEWPALPLEF
jgi:HEPN domain-containing protein